MIDDLLLKLEDDYNINSFVFGHTPTQIEYFQTTNQQGNDKWEYWQHILQLKSLHSALSELNITHNELQYELKDAYAFWPFWSYKKRKRTIPRIQFRIDTIQTSIVEKVKEIENHLKIIDTKYSHLKNITEDDILKEESIYWTQRLGRQLGVSHLSKMLGVSESELLAVISLPKEQQKAIFDGMKQILGSTSILLPNKTEGNK